MALIDRMAKLFTADLHAVLDRIEEPATLLQQAVREMEEALAGAERRMAELEREREALTARKAQAEATLLELAEQLEVCFSSGNDELARKLIRRRLQAERRIRQLAERIDAIGKAVATARAETAADRERLEHVRQKAELLAEQAEADAAAESLDPLQRLWGGVDVHVGDDEVEVAFLREKQRRARS